MIPLGEVIVHGNAERAIQDAHQRVEEFLDQFQRGDFGSIDRETHEFNKNALRHGGDLLGCYELCSGVPLWIISDGHTTEVVLPI